MSRPAIFVTGAAAGIGRATAELFASRGWFVGLYDIDDAGVREVAKALPKDAYCTGKLDVTDPAAFASALAQFWRESGQRLDLLFNNAGIVAVDDFEKIPLARHHAIADVNFKGVMNGCHAAADYLKRTPGARVISMSSASAIYGTPAFASYSASKFAVKGFTEALNAEWARFGIVVMDVLPLFVDTPMTRQFEMHPKSMDTLGMHLNASDIARTVWRAAHWRLWPRVHWYPSLQGWFLALLNKLTPGWLTRWTTRLISGY